MLSIFLFIFAIIAGILGLVFFIIGLTQKHKQKIITGSVILGLALILFFFSLSQLMHAYFNFIGKMMEKSKQNEYRHNEREFANEDFLLTDADFPDTIFDADSTVFLFHSLKEFQTKKGPDLIAIYRQEGFAICSIIDASLYNDKQLNIVISDDCSFKRPEIAEVYNENDILTNSSSFVQYRSLENRETEIQYILRKDLNKEESHYIVLKYE